MFDNFLESNELCATIQKEIAPLIKDTDFEDMYAGGGRPPISPRVMLLTLIMQFLERLSDRAAANNLKYRIDWKIAFGLPIDFPGIHNTTLVLFRDRLIENEKSSHAFDKILDHLKSIGLVKKGQKQRIDSTHVIGNVRELSRLDLLHETLRLFCKDISIYQNYFDEKLLNCHALYVDKLSTRGVTKEQRDKYITEAGVAMKGFIEWGQTSIKSKEVRELQSYKTLELVFSQNFEDENPDPEKPPKLIKIATGKGHICSPHETDARYSSKGGKGWIGYKSQVAETVGEEVNFITYIESTDSTDHDSTTINNFVQQQEEKEIKPSEVFGDTHYNTESNIENLLEKNIELKGPVVPAPKNKVAEKNQRFSLHENKESVICSEGIKSKKLFIHKDGKKFSASFHAKDCDICVRKKICQPEKRGKQIVKTFESDLLKSRRELMLTDKFKKEMYQRNGIEGTISGLVRGQGMRRARYRGKAKAFLQNKLIGASANISRLHRYNKIIKKRSELIMDQLEELLAA